MILKDVTLELDGLEYQVSYVCEQGGRPSNEDYVFVGKVGNSILLCAADGLGAHGGGDIASKIAVNTAEEFCCKNRKITSNSVRKLFKCANEAVLQQHFGNIEMKTTLATVIINDKFIYTGHLGDTRIYTFDKSGNLYYTADHSLAYIQMRKERGSLEDIRRNPSRHYLTAAIGTQKLKKSLVLKKRNNKDTSFLICSDGFWEYVNEEKMIECFLYSSDSSNWLEKMMEIHKSNVVDNNDNFSAICLKQKF